MSFQMLSYVERIQRRLQDRFDIVCWRRVPVAIEIELDTMLDSSLFFETHNRQALMQEVVHDTLECLFFFFLSNDILRWYLDVIE